MARGDLLRQSILAAAGHGAPEQRLAVGGPVLGKIPEGDPSAGDSLFTLEVLALAQPAGGSSRSPEATPLLFSIFHWLGPWAPPFEPMSLGAWGRSARRPQAVGALGAWVGGE